jgi:3-dehydroquinate synthase
LAAAAGPFMIRPMPTVRVDLEHRGYEVIVEPGCLAEAGERIRSAGLGGRAALITDANVARHHAETVMVSLHDAGFEPSCHLVPAGEASKCLEQIENLCRSLAEAGHDRRSFVVALGGGVVGDLAGFAAAVFYRGVDLVQVPTTIVAQVDSSIGGKTGVNIPEGKNLVGAFHQPRLVVVDPESLRTLPDREFHEGFAEVIKHAAIRDAGMLDEIGALDPSSRELPAELIARNLAIKARIVEEDERETAGTRALLNFGHTIGHGIEAAVPYGELLHGEAIALGIRAALALSEDHADLDPAASRRILSLLRSFGLPLTLPPQVETATVMDKLARDKKFAAGSVRFIVLDAPGRARVSDLLVLDDLRRAVDALRDEPESPE